MSLVSYGQHCRWLCHTYDDGWNDDKGERPLFIRCDTEAAKCWSSRVLTEISEPNGRRNDEQEGRDTGQDGQGFRKVLRTLHFRNERGEQNLRYPEEGNVENCVHSTLR